MGQKLNNAKGLYLEGIRDGNPVEAVYKYTGERYTQHSTGVRDGQEGFIEFFLDFIQRNPERDIEILRGWEDGQHVFIHAFQSINKGAQQWITTDFFDTDENDKIIEHWDVISAFESPVHSTDSSISGNADVSDIAKTDVNKQLVQSILDSAINSNTALNANNSHFSDQYVQHYPNDFIGAPSYHELVLLVGQGNFVATLAKANLQGIEVALVDIFSIEKGKVVEHWVNFEPVPTPEEARNSGKF